MKNTILGGTIVLLIAIGATGWIMYIHQTNKLATLGAEIEEKEEKIPKLQKENEKIEKRMNNLESLAKELDNQVDAYRKWYNDKISDEERRNIIDRTQNRLEKQGLYDNGLFQELNIWG